MAVNKITHSWNEDYTGLIFTGSQRQPTLVEVCNYCVAQHISLEGVYVSAVRLGGEWTPPEDAKSLEIFEFGENCPICGKAFVLDTDICPSFLTEGTPGWQYWKVACRMAEKSYFELLDWGCTPQEARAVLPTCLKTEVVMTANLREWRHFFKLRTAPAAHPQMREVAIPLLHQMRSQVPVIFDDIEEAAHETV